MKLEIYRRPTRHEEAEIIYLHRQDTDRWYTTRLLPTLQTHANAIPAGGSTLATDAYLLAHKQDQQLPPYLIPSQARHDLNDLEHIATWEEKKIIPRAMLPHGSRSLRYLRGM